MSVPTKYHCRGGSLRPHAYLICDEVTPQCAKHASFAVRHSSYEVHHFAVQNFICAPVQYYKEEHYEYIESCKDCGKLYDRNAPPFP